MRLSLEDGLEVVGETGDAAEASDLTHALRPDVILVDADMLAGVDATVLTERLRSIAPWSAVVILTLRDDATARERAWAAGAASFVAKHRTEETLLAAIRGVAVKGRCHHLLSAGTQEERTDDTEDAKNDGLGDVEAEHLFAMLREAEEVRLAKQLRDVREQRGVRLVASLSWELRRIASGFHMLLRINGKPAGN